MKLEISDLQKAVEKDLSHFVGVQLTWIKTFVSIFILDIIINFGYTNTIHNHEIISKHTTWD